MTSSKAPYQQATILRKSPLACSCTAESTALAQISPHTRQSRQRLGPQFGHGRGIIVDIFYDHFLAAHWSDYSTEPLESYADRVYRLLQEQHAQLPTGLQQVALRMIEHNWLVSYRQRHVVGRALERIAQRLSRPLPLADSVNDLAAHEALYSS